MGRLDALRRFFGGGRRAGDGGLYIRVRCDACGEVIQARINPSAEARVRVLQTGGVIGLVGAGGQGEAIPDSQIDNVRMLLANKVHLDPYHFLKVGQRVRVRRGVDQDAAMKVIADLQALGAQVEIEPNRPPADALDRNKSTSLDQ